MIWRLLPDAAAVGPDLAPTPTDSDRNFPAHPAPRTMLGLLFALMLVLLLAPEPSAAEQPVHAEALSADVTGVDALLRRLTEGSFSLVDGSSKVVGRRRQGDAAPEPLAEQSVVETLQSAALSDAQVGQALGILRQRHKRIDGDAAHRKGPDQCQPQPESARAAVEHIGGPGA